MVKTDEARIKKMSENIRATLDALPNRVEFRYARQDPPTKVVLVLGWSKRGYGFGEFSIHQDEHGEFFIDTECSSRETVKEIFGWIVDTAILDHGESPERHRQFNAVMGRECSEGCGICYPKKKT